MLIERTNTIVKVKIIYKDQTVEDLSQDQVIDNIVLQRKRIYWFYKDKKIESEINKLENLRIVIKIME